MRRAAPLGELADFINGYAFAPADWHEDGLPIIRIQNLTDATKPFNRTRAQVSEKYRVAPGELLVSWSASLGVFEWRGPEAGLVNQHIFRVKPRNGVVEQAYLRHALHIALDEMKRHLHGATMQHVNRGEFLATPVPLPSLSEQRRIAAILDEADALRAKRRAALAQLDEMARAIFVEMFGTPPYPETMALGDCVEEFRYGTSEKSAAHGRPTLRIPNVIGGRVDLTDLKLVPVDEADFRRLRLRGGDVLFVRTNGNPENVGRCAAITDDLGADCGLSPADFVYASYLIRARLRPEKLVPTFLCAFLASEAGRNQVREHAKTSAGQFNINTDGLGAIRIPAADLAQQRAFAMRLDRVTATRTELLRHSKTLDSLFASLQHRAFRGDL